MIEWQTTELAGLVSHLRRGPPVENVAILVAVFLGGIVSGFAGFAFSAVAGVILLHLLAPVLAIPLMMSCTIVSQLTTLLALRRSIDWSEAVPLTLGGVVGLPVGLSLMMFAPPQSYRVAFGLMLLGYSIYMLLKRPVAKLAGAATPALHSAVGFAGGMIGGFTAMPGALPVIWCELRGVPRERQRGVVQPFILVMQALAIALLFFNSGTPRTEIWHYTLVALPALGGGILVGFLLYSRVDAARFRAAILWLLLFCGALMVF
jgi:uncharacterized membrane protein YfcA